MSTHTPGPWWPIKNSAGQWEICTRRDRDPADVKPYRYGATIGSSSADHTEDRTRGTGEANARLMAAAPELLEALKKIAVALDRFDSGHPLVSEAMVAIANAKGQQ